MNQDIIAAVASGMTGAGIGIVRISGAGSFALAERIFVTKSGEKPDLSENFKVHYGFITGEPDGACKVDIIKEPGDVSPWRSRILDEVLLLNMRGPHSYTGEDTIEIDCHGGPYMMQKILRRVLSEGARLAEPGEFTKRAFLNGRLDLAQAESVAGIISARNDDALRASVQQLRGAVSDKVHGLRAVLLEDTAYIEAALDDPEHLSLDGFSETLSEHLEYSRKEIKRLLDTADDGRIVREGINTVILGSPNAGKSSLLNALLGEERAIVTDIAGTTRDTLEESMNSGGVQLNFTDTAGIRESADTIEQIGVKKALEKAGKADLVLLVLDSAKGVTAEERQLLETVRELPGAVIAVLNKQDLLSGSGDHACDGPYPHTVQPELQELLPGLSAEDIIPVSARTGEGLPAILSRIRERFYRREVGFNEEILLTSERHRQLLSQADEALWRVQGSLAAGLPEDFYTIDLTDACTALGTITGENADEDLVNEIFSKFCMGK